MKSFKKRTIALVLASVVAVAGSFAADNYKNSLMALEFENNSNGTINMSVQTKTSYSGNVTPIQSSANTFVLMLPEINSLAQTPDITKVGNIESVNIRTMPYSANGKGYTKITVKTFGTTKLIGQNKIYIPLSEPVAKIETIDNSSLNNRDINKPQAMPTKSVQQTTNLTDNTIKQVSEDKNIAQQEQQSVTKENNNVNTDTVNVVSSSDNTPDSSTIILMLMSVLLILVCIIYFFLKAKDKMHELTGERININTEEENKEKEKQNKNNKLREIKDTINKLDAKYGKTSSSKKQNTNTIKNTSVENSDEDISEINNIVDLDELFNSNQLKKIDANSSEENDALEDFLNYFEEENQKTENAEEFSYDEDLYNEILANNSLKFSNNDVKKINKLLNQEIDDDTIQNLDKYLVTNPIPLVQMPDEKKLLENFVTEYSISQNIVFTSHDIEALKKLINVELDDDFITNLKTNPKRTKEISKEILNHKPKKIVKDMQTLKVQNTLPDLNEELKKQGNKVIPYENKPDVVYYSEGYEYQTLKVDSALSDINGMANKYGNKYKPDNTIQYVDDSRVYDVDKFYSTENLPDLDDVVKNPQKYEEKASKKFIPNEKEMLSSIKNVTFKPFYDGSTEFEVLNKFDDNEAKNNNDDFDFITDLEIPKEDELMTLIEAESEEENIKSPPEEEIKEQKEDKETKKQKELPNVQLQRTVDRQIRPKHVQNEKSNTELLEKIEKLRKEREDRKKLSKQHDTSKLNVNSEQNDCAITYVIDEKSYTVLSSVSFDNTKGCHLAKSDTGYALLTYINSKIEKIKDFKTLKSTKLQARLNEKFPNNTSRYIVRIATTKFIVDVTENSINYVMDLC